MGISKRLPLGGLWLLIGLLALVGCSGMGSQAPVVVQQGAEETAAAATAFYATETQVAVEAQYTPTPTSTPYMRPTDSPAIDPDTVIATVAGHDITVGEFRNRIRYQRWSALESLRRIADLSGFEVIDITDPTNTMTPTVIGYLVTLDDAETFGEQVLELMIQERILHQEFVNRGLEGSQRLIDNLWLRLLQLEAAPDGGLPENFEAQRDAFMESLAAYTDISLVDLRFLITVQSEQQFVAEAVGAEAEMDVEALNLRHILVETEAEANEIIALLEDGADFNELAHERSIDTSARGDGGDLGYFARGEMVEPFEEAAFAAEVGDLVGPVQSDYGYHVIEILDQQYEVEARRLVLDTEDAAQMALERLESGESFDDVLAALQDDPGVVVSSNDLGWLSPEDLPESLWGDLFAAEVGSVVGPMLTSDGYNVIEITDRRVGLVHARHILVETEAEAEDVLARLRAGEDFATLAGELSIDPGAQGNDGELGFITSDQLPEDFADAVYAAETGEIIGPIETDYGWHIAQVTDRELSVLSPQQYDEIKALHFQNWLRAEIRAVEIDEVWRQVVPADPQPVDVAPFLGELADALDEALAAMGAGQ
ncbi:MAG: peptidylprolyl isomerase [Anaerolineae bacterium]|nr:peptidylprolyl isomerase [Anaerolineae bacterium]